MCVCACVRACVMCMPVTCQFDAGVISPANGVLKHLMSVLTQP